MAGNTSLQQPLLQHKAPAGILTQYVIDRDKSNQEYISKIPKYTGSVIPNILNRERTVRSFEYNYCYLESFLEYFGKYHEDESWVLAGLLSETGIISSAPFVGQIMAAVVFAKESKCRTQILCKKYDNKIVFLINVDDSEKTGLNTLFSNKIMIMTLPPRPISSTPTDAPPPITVPDGGFGGDTILRSRVVFYSVGDTPHESNRPEPIRDIREDIDSIEKRLTKTSIFVIDPNRVDGTVKVDWFGNMSLNDINGLIVSSGILGNSTTSREENVGGKSRYSKKRVTKRRKTTKHRKSTKRRPRRRTSRK
jgi:hypothetical protein